MLNENVEKEDELPQNALVSLPEENLKELDLTKSSGNVKREFTTIKYFEPIYINDKIKKIEDMRHRLLCKVMWETGIRVTEVISIKKKDINFDNHLLTIRWLKNRKFNTRIIPLHMFLIDILKFYTSPLIGEERLFPYSRIRVYQIVKKYFNGHPHQLRHSFAVNWLKKGGDLYQLKEYLGHKRFETTEVYLKVHPKDLAKELYKINFE